MPEVKRELSIAVRTLVEIVSRSGDLTTEFFGAVRSVEAIRAHQKVQKSRPETYTAEVAVTHRMETERFLLKIGGRIDGVFHETDRVIIDEIKTTTRPLEEYEKKENPVHWSQAKVYAFIYGADQGLEIIDVQLTYYRIDSGETREFLKSFDLAELRDFFDDLVDRWLRWAETIADWSEIRDISIEALAFPFDGFREGQRRMAVAVYRAVVDDGQLLVQAATGIGKTMAAVFPSVKAMVKKEQPKLFYLTARTTGRAVAEQALGELRRAGLRFKSLTLTAKDKICFDPDAACTPDECRFAKGYYDRLGGALEEMFREDALTREAVEAMARKHEVCPFEFSLDLSLWVDCIVCDYNYAFDPRVYLRRFFDDERGNYIFLVDEAHNLVDRAREMFSASIRKKAILETRRAVGDELPRIRECLSKINSWLLEAGKEFEASDPWQWKKDPPEDLYPHMRGFLRTTERWLARNIKTPFRESLLEQYFTINGFMKVAEQYDETYAACYERDGKDLTVKLFCIDPSNQMEKALKRCDAAIFFSATLTPSVYFKKILGCSTDIEERNLPTPFPPENLDLYIADRISTLFRHRDRTRLQVARAILELVRQRRGNYLLFFPSYKYMKMVHESFASESPDGEFELLVQTPGMTEPERDAFLTRFRGDNRETLVGFVVMGGIFGEGIDLAGDRLSGAVIVGVGLPGVSPERELIREYFAHHEGVGFEFAYQYPGFNRVLQAVGRVIRSETDRGVVMLIDSRFGERRYRTLFPERWRPRRLKSPEQLRRDLKRFWIRGGEKQGLTSTPMD